MAVSGIHLLAHAPNLFHLDVGIITEQAFQAGFLANCDQGSATQTLSGEPPARPQQRTPSRD